MITAQPGHKLRALQAGAKDFISKPFDVVEVRTRIHNLLEVRLLYKQLENYSNVLEATVQERTAELRESEARFRSLTELASDWYWEQDEHGNFTRVSGPVLEMLGLRVDTLAGSPNDAQVPGWNEEERQALQDTIAARQPFLDFVFSRWQFPPERDGAAVTPIAGNVQGFFNDLLEQGHRHLSRMSFLTDVTPLTPRATSTALLISARELTKPLN